MNSDSPSIEVIQEALHILKEIKSGFAAKGWFPATSGNLSVRIGGFEPNRFQLAITSSGKDKSLHSASDYLIVDQDGQPVLPTSSRPSAETSIHCEIYKATGCGAIFHVHTVAGTLASELYEPRGSVPIRGVELIKAFNIWEEDAAIEIPILPNYAKVERIAALVAQAVRPDVPGILLAKHGVYAWGANVFEAKRHLEAFEFLFDYAVRRASIPALNES